MRSAIQFLGIQIVTFLLLLCYNRALIGKMISSARSEINYRLRAPNSVISFFGSNYVSSLCAHFSTCALGVCHNCFPNVNLHS